jgi:hypothetical protein
MPCVAPTIGVVAVTEQEMVMEVLSKAECLERLGDHHFGRISMVAGRQPIIRRPRCPQSRHSTVSRRYLGAWPEKPLDPDRIRAHQGAPVAALVSGAKGSSSPG